MSNDNDILKSSFSNNNVSENDAKEAEMQQKQMLLLKLFFIGLKNRVIAMAVIFVLCLASVVALFVVLERSANDRYTAKAGLFFKSSSSSFQEAMSISKAVHIFMRRDVQGKLCDTLKLSDEDSENLRDNIKIECLKGQSHLILLTVSAKTQELTVDMANTLAELCVQAYYDYQQEGLLKSKRAYQTQIEEAKYKIDNYYDEYRALAESVGVSNPEDELEMFYSLITQQAALLSQVNIEYDNAVNLFNSIDKEIQKVGTHKLSLINNIKVYQARIDKLKNDLMQMELIYTEKNPKLISARSDYNEAQDDYQKFLSANNILSENLPQNIEYVEAKIAEYDQLKLQITALERTKKSISSEIDLLNKKTQQVVKIMPQITLVENARRTQNEILKELENNIITINTDINNLKNDVSIMEEVTYAYPKSEFGLKMLLISLIIAGFIAISSGSMMVIWQLLFGKMAYPEEIKCIYNVTPIGNYPKNVEDFSSLQAKQMVESKIFNNCEGAFIDGKVIIFNRLFEESFSPEFLNSILHNATIRGQRFFHLYIDYIDSSVENSYDFEEDCLIVQKDKNHGVLFLSQTIEFLSPELELLKNDLEVLAKKYDKIILHNTQELTLNHTILYQQCLNLCDGMVLLTAEKQTKWSLFRYFMQLSKQEKSATCPLAVAMLNHNKWTTKKERFI